MRLGPIIAVLTGCLAAVPCAADDGLFRDAPLMAWPARTRGFGAAPIDTHLPLAAKVRLRTGLVAAPFAQAPVRLRARAQTAMIDFYPLDGRGFHLSGGTRFYARRALAADVDPASRGLLVLPTWRGGGGMRTGFRRFSPTATIGYTSAVTTGLDIGVEAGARIGGAFNRGPHPMRLAPRLGGDRGPHEGVVPMANLLVAYHF